MKIETDCGRPAEKESRQILENKQKTLHLNLKNSVGRIRKHWENQSKAIQILMIYSLSTALYLAILSSPVGIISDYARLIPGLLSFILVPGILWSNVLLPEGSRRLWLSIILGLLFNCFAIQILFLVRLFLSITTNLIYFVILMNSIPVIICALFDYWRGLKIEWKASISHNGGSKLTKIVLVGLVLRLVLYLFGTSSIAPDASFYADCARSLLNGEFTSNVLVDSRIYELWGGVQYWFHEGFIFLMAISWILMEPFTAGPNLALIIAGLCLILLSHDLTSHIFNKNAAIQIAGIISVHPILLFHSVVAYGPEITSLFFLLGGITLIVKRNDSSPTEVMLGGILIGFADIIWSPNYFLFSLGLTLFFLISRLTDRRESIALAIGSLLVGSARVFFLDLNLFILILSILLSLILGITIFSKENVRKTRYFFVGVIGTILLWRFPIQISKTKNLFSGLSLWFDNNLNPMQLPNPPINIFQKSVSAEVILRALFFLLFHATPVILGIALFSVFVGDKKRETSALLSISLVGLVGTVFVLNSLASFKMVMTPYYIFTDSRFFLSIVTLVIISTGGYFQRKRLESLMSISWKKPFADMSNRDRKKIAVVVLIAIGMIPGYLAIPTGLQIVDYNSRYGWVNLKSVVEAKTSSDSRFIVDRTTEFSWLTGRESAEMPGTGSRNIVRALSYLENYAASYDAGYFIVDGYTIANRERLRPLMFTTLEAGKTIPSSTDFLPESSSQNSTGLVNAVQLIATTPSNARGEFARIYSFSEQSFSLAGQVNLLDAGWTASEGGLIENASGNARLVIGPEGVKTHSLRSNGFDLNQSISNGYILIRTGASTANLEGVSLWANSGEIIGHTQYIGSSYHFAPIGECILGDIRIEIEGNATDYVTINSLTIWEAY